jgi:IS30 family transposase
MKKNEKGGIKSLTLRERIDIEYKYRYDDNFVDIVKYLNRDRSTIYRKINKKHIATHGKYIQNKT